jgi:hypothetical protein
MLVRYHNVKNLEQTEKDLVAAVDVKTPAAGSPPDEL